MEATSGEVPEDASDKIAEGASVCQPGFHQSHRNFTASRHTWRASCSKLGLRDRVQVVARAQA
jgi:hypothetical protein